MEKIEYASLSERVYQEKLPNGLQVYVAQRPDYGKQFAFFATYYGGMNLRFRDENGDWVDTPAGIAHYLEHKLFETEDGSAQQVLAASGAVDNAFTDSDLTGYYIECTRDFEENLRTLLSFVSVPYFTRESVEKERGIIAQEIRMVEDDPYSESFYQLRELMYLNHPCRTRIAGTLDSIAQLTPEILYQCHRAFYRPGNMVLCVAGSVDPERVCAIAREVLTPEFSTATETDLGKAEPPGVACAYAEKSMEVSAPLFNLGFKGEAVPRGQALRQRLMAELACEALSGPSSPLYGRLYEAGLINNTFESYYASVPGAAYFVVGGESRQPELVRDEVCREAARLAAQGIDPVLWDRLVRAAYGTMVRQLNSLEGTCIELAQAYFEGDEYLRFPEVFQSIEKADAEALLGRWCTAERTALSVIRPLE